MWVCVVCFLEVDQVFCDAVHFFDKSVDIVAAKVGLELDLPVLVFVRLFAATDALERAHQPAKVFSECQGGIVTGGKHKAVE